MKLLSTFILLLFILSTQIYSQQTIIINEVMYAPVTGAGKEWFELYNVSTQSVDIKGWKWKDATTSLRTITNNNYLITPGSFVVVCEDSSAIKQFYPGINGIIIQSIGWNAINNTGDQLIIYDSLNSRKDSLSFTSSWGGSSGNKSMERISYSAPTIQQSNWGTSISLSGATPNKINSISLKTHDLKLNNLSFNKNYPKIGDTINIIVNIKNVGTSASTGFTLNLFEDLNYDSIALPNELINSFNITSVITPGDSVDRITQYHINNSNVKQFIAKIYYTSDQDTLNNTLIRSLIIQTGDTNSSIVINEIMFDPAQNECEWFEIYNNSDSVINLYNWKVKDLNSSPVTLFTSPFYLYPDSFLVISKSDAIFNNHPSLDQSKVVIVSGLPALNNDMDAVVLLRPNNIISDSIIYKGSWGTDEYSIERIDINSNNIDSTNWKTSISCENSTPALQNSVITAVRYTYHDLVVNEIMYSPLTNKAEWIELYNSSVNIVDLNGWILTETGGNYRIFNNCSTLVYPGSYVVIASDSAILDQYSYLKNLDTTDHSINLVILDHSLGLNDDGDMIKITDAFNITIDSLYYLDKWHNPNFPDTKGISLEKINPGLESFRSSSWSSSADINGGTPGKKNSLFTQNLNIQASVSVSPNPFSPDNDGFEDNTLINYNLTSVFSQVRVKIYDVKGRLVRDLVNNRTMGSTGSIVFDGLDNEKRKLRLGIYIVFLEALNDQNGIVESVKTTLVVAAKL